MPKMYCHFCSGEVDTNDVGAYKLVQGWVSNRKRGANAVTLSSGIMAWGHGHCVDQEKREGAISRSQERMF